LLHFHLQRFFFLLPRVHTRLRRFRHLPSIHFITFRQPMRRVRR
jgi:hypothetical protein